VRAKRTTILSGSTKAFEYHQKFDYVDFATPNRDMMAEYTEKANDFYKEIDAFLRNENKTNH